MTVALIDYGAGNLHSVYNALKAAGASGVAVTADPEVVLRADRVVLPGVGAFGACAAGLRGISGMVEALDARVRHGGVPFLGVCVGMQLMARCGEEMGEHPGLGWMDGVVRALVPAPGIRVPHMGWNDVIPTVPHPLIEAGEAYFLHSFAYEGANDGGGVIAASEHGGPLTAAIGRDNLCGVQFHPEKSQRYGIALMERFLKWKP